MTAVWLREMPIAHRGLHGGNTPENSLAAFEAAIKAGVAIEFDVRATADGEPVIFHDETLVRMTGARGRVERTSAKTLAALSLAGSGERIPTLRGALERIGSRAPVLAEIKPRGLKPHIAAVLGDHAGALAVQSFDPLIVIRLKRLLPAIPCGFLAGSADRLMLAAAIRPDFIAYDVRKGSRRLAQRLTQTLGVPLLLWTVRAPSEHAIAEALKANVIFENSQAAPTP